ncbi:MAG TPA: WD40 repeat domain-containing protein, partial [Gemmataceae bacterium]|nr:WD40 repeat domain-containing protein [Gemmataceae bacterium]
WFAEIVERLLEKDPANRLGSAREVSELLEGCLAHLQHPAAAPLPASISKPVTASAPRRRSYRILGAITMMATLGLVLCGAMAMFATDPPDIAGTWSGEDWGKVVLKKTDDGGYAGTYTDTFGQSPGAITLKWSRIERRFNGIWREGDDRFGELSVRLVGNEIRGALTTDAKSRINPATPKLADLAWRRDGTAGTTPLPTGPMPRSPGHGSPMPVPTNPGAVYWPPGSPAPAAPKTGGALPGNGMSSAPETPGRPRPIEPPYSKAPPTPFPTPTATFAPPRVWAIAKYPPANGPWWTPEGHVLSTRPIDPDGLDLRSVADPKLAWYVVLLRVPGGFDPLINGDAIRVVGRPWFSLGRQSLQARQYLASRQGGEVVALAVGLPAAAVSFDLTVEAAIGSWQSISYMHSQGVGKKNETTDSGAEWRVAERSGRLQIDVELPKADGQWRIAVKNDGNLSFTPVLVPDAKNGPMTRLQAEIPGPIDLKGNVSFVLQSRRYEKIHLGKIALRPESGDGKGPGRITMPSELEPPPVIPKANGQVLRKITVNGGVSALAASPDGKLLAVAAHGGPDSVFVLDVELGGVRKLSSSDDNEKAILAAEMHLRNVTVASQVETLAFSPDGKLLALGTNVGQVKLYDASSGELVRSFDDVDRKRKNLPKFLELRLAHGSVRSLAFSPDGKTLATCGSAIDYARDHIARDFYRAATEGLLKTWDVKTGQRLIDFKNVYRGYVFDVAFSPDGSELASVGNGGKAGWVQLFDPHSGKVKRSIGSQAGPGAREVTTCLAYSPDGKRLAVGFKLLDKTKDQNSGMFALLSPASGVVDSKQTSLSPITKIAFTPDGTEVATLASESNVLKFWDASAGTQRSEMRLGVPGEPVRLTTFAFLPQARILALGGASGGCVELRALEIVPAIRP